MAMQGLKLTPAEAKLIAKYFGRMASKTSQQSSMRTAEQVTEKMLRSETTASRLTASPRTSAEDTLTAFLNCGAPRKSGMEAGPALGSSTKAARREMMSSGPVKNAGYGFAAKSL